MTAERQIRALYTAQTIPDLEPPYNSLHLKIYYPALYNGSLEERNSGQLPVDSSNAPYPVFIMLPGINTPPDSYAWLARHLVANNIICVTYSLIVSELGYISLSPGLDIDALRPANYGNKPVCLALNPIIEKLTELNQNGELKNLFDLDNIILGGHSGGGTAALYSANPEFHHGVKGAIAYGAHTGATTFLGWPENTVLPLKHDLPVMILGGDRDGVIAASNFRYGGDVIPQADDSWKRLERSFTESLRDNDNKHVLAIINGANHSSLCHPADTSTGRPFLDWPANNDEQNRQLIAELVTAFCQDATSKQTGSQPTNNHQVARLLESLSASSQLTLAKTR
jgi:predicted dienelactone hydrolase